MCHETRTSISRLYKHFLEVIQVEIEIKKLEKSKFHVYSLKDFIKNSQKINKL